MLTRLVILHSGSISILCKAVIILTECHTKLATNKTKSFSNSVANFNHLAMFSIVTHGQQYRQLTEFSLELKYDISRSLV